MQELETYSLANWRQEAARVSFYRQHYWSQQGCVRGCMGRSPIDVVAHARDESGQEHEGLPFWVLFTGDATHIAVGPAVTLHTGGQDSV